MKKLLLFCISALFALMLLACTSEPKETRTRVAGDCMLVKLESVEGIFYGVESASGERFISLQYDSVIWRKDLNAFLAYQKGKFSFYDHETCSQPINRLFKGVRRVEDMLAFNDESGFFLYSPHLRLHLKRCEMFSIRDGFIFIRHEGLWGLYDRSLKSVVPPECSILYVVPDDLSNNYMIIKFSGGQWRCYDQDGKIAKISQDNIRKGVTMLGVPYTVGVISQRDYQFCFNSKSSVN